MSTTDKNSRRQPTRPQRVNNNRAPKRSPQKAAGQKKVNSSRARRIAAEKRRRKREMFAVKLVLFLTFYLILSLIITGFIFFSLKTKANSLDVEYIEIVVDQENSIKIPGDTVVKNNVLYIPYEKLDKLCNFVLTGDNSKITLIINSSADYVSFYRNSNLAFIGGSSYRLDAPVLFETDDYYIPLDFIDKYMNGININHDQANNVYTLELSVEPLSFTSKFPSSTDKIDVSSVPGNVSLPETSEEEETSTTSDASQN